MVECIVQSLILVRGILDSKVISLQSIHSHTQTVRLSCRDNLVSWNMIPRSSRFGTTGSQGTGVLQRSEVKYRQELSSDKEEGTST